MSNRFSVEAIFKAVDRMSRPVRRIGIAVLRQTRRMELGLRKVDKALVRVGSRFRRGFTTSAKIAAAGIGTITGAVVFLISKFSQIENATNAFTPLLGSVEKAKKLVEDLQETGATTPFEFKDLADATQSLVAMGAAGEDNVIPMLRMLGDVAKGNRDNLQRLAINFGEISANGRAMTRDLRQFTTAGVPLIKELGKMLGVSTARIQDMASQGKITDKLVTQALKNMTGEGGAFFKAMEIANNSVTGLWSNLQDEITRAAAAIGTGMAPVIKDLLRDLILVAQGVREWAKANQDLIGAKFKEYVKLVKDSAADVFKWGKRLLWFTAIYIGFMTVVKASIAVLTLFNTVMAMNPFVLVGIAIATATAALVWFISNIEKVAATFRNMSPVFKIVSLGLITLLGGPIASFIAAVAIIASHWTQLKLFFTAFFIGLNKIANMFGIDLGMVWEGIKIAFTAVFNTIGFVAKNVFEGIKIVVKAVTSTVLWLIDKIQKAIELAKDLGGFAVDLVKSGGIKTTNTTGLISRLRQKQLLKESQDNEKVVSRPEPQVDTNNTITSDSEVTIKDETGKAEITKTPNKRTGSIKLVRTGGF